MDAYYPMREDAGIASHETHLPKDAARPKLVRALSEVDLSEPDLEDEPGELRVSAISGGTLLADVHCIDWGQVRASSVDLASRDLEESSLVDVVFSTGDLSNCNLRGSALRRVEFQEVRMTGSILAEAKLRDVRFVGCRLDLANLRFAELERVEFISCQLSELDLQNAKLTSVRFEDCRLDRADLLSASFERTSMRGCSFDGTRGLLALRGVLIPWPEIVELAGGLAAAVGIGILEAD